MAGIKRDTVYRVFLLFIIASCICTAVPSTLFTTEEYEMECKPLEYQVVSGSIHETREDSGRITLDLNRTKTITGDKIYGEIILRDNAVLNIENANLEITGLIDISGDALISIKGSTVVMESPDLPRDKPLINISGNAHFFIENSDVTINPFPFDPTIYGDDDTWLTEHGSYAPFILSDDDSRVTIVDRSVFTVHLPSKVIPEYYQEQLYITAGTILLAGRSSWSVGNSKMDAYLHSYYCENNDSHVTRWFWLSMQGDSFLKLDHSEATLKECTLDRKTIFKPTQGIVEILDSTVTGEVLIETVSKVKIANSTFHVPPLEGMTNELNFPIIIMDRTNTVMTNSKIYGNIEIGWSSAIQGYGRAASTVLMERCTVKGNMTGYTTATISLIETTMEKGEVWISDNTTLNVKDCDLPYIGIWMGHHEVLWNIPEKVVINLLDSSVDEVNVLPKVAPLYPPTFIDAALKTPINISLSLRTSDIGELNLSSDASFDMLVTDNSNIDSFTEPERGIFNTTVIEAATPEIPAGTVITHIKKRLDVTTTLNDEPLEGVEVTISYKDENILVGRSDKNGTLSSLVYDRYTTGSTTKVWEYYYKVELRYLTLRKTENVLLLEDSWVYPIDYNWIDTSGPEIADIEHSPAGWNAMKPVSIRSSVKDDGVGVVRNVTLMYKVNDGKWRYNKMYDLGDGTYECVIPQQGFYSRVEYIVIATDAVGNKQYSPRKTYDVGDDELTILYIIIFVPIILILVISVVKWRRRQRIIRYMKRGKRRRRKK